MGNVGEKCHMDFSGLLLKEHTIWGGLRWNLLTEKRLKKRKCLEQYGYKVYSQNDEDGIIQEIFRRIGVTNKTFIEFGVQNGLESNCHYLLFQGWNGLWMDGDGEAIREIQKRFYPVLKTGQLACKRAFITRENINQLISEQGFSGEVDLLSIDVDGNDYYIWEAVTAVSPRVVIIEYNGKLPPDCDWKMAYHAYHVWEGSDWHGASLKALERLGERLGYQLVGTGLVGVNAFFVKKEIAGNLFYKPATAEALYNPLRLLICHKCGHPARYCLAGQQEGLGLLNYEPDAIAAADFGFHGREYQNSGMYAQWMSEAKSQIIIREDQEAIHAVAIPYNIPAEVLRSVKKPYSVTIQVEREEPQVLPVEQEAGEFCIALPDTGQAFLRITFTVSELWSPAEVLGTGDGRSLGLNIHFSEIRAIEDAVPGQEL